MKTLDEQKAKIIEQCIRDAALLDKAYAKRDLNLASGCREYDYYLGELKKLEPKKSYVELTHDIENYSTKIKKIK